MRPAPTLLPLLVLVLASCGSAPGRPVAGDPRDGDDPSAPSRDAPFRTTAPTVDLDAPLPRIAVEPFALDNGLRGLVVQRRGFPVVAAMLALDTTDLEAGDVGGRRAEYLSGVFLSPPEGRVDTTATCDAVGCGIVSKGRSDKLGDVLGHIDEAAALDGPDALYAQRLEDRWRGEQQSAGDPGRALRRISAALIFGPAHRYGDAAPSSPPRLAELKALHRSVFDPRRATLCIVGDVSLEDATAEATRRFGGWHAGAPLPSTAPDPPPQPSTSRIVVFPAANMAQILGNVLARGPVPTDDDFAAFLVLVELLGGSPGSEAFQHVREEMGAAYRIQSTVTWLHGASVMTLGGSFDREKAVVGMSRLLQSVRTVREQGPTSDALVQARRVAVTRWRSAMATDEGIAKLLGGSVLDAVPVQSTLDLPARIRAVQAADVQAAASKYLDAAALRIVLVGDPSFLLETPSLRFGAPVLVDGYGRPLARPPSRE